MTDESKPPCPLCGSQASRTLATRWREDQRASLRRRVCLECGGRFSTLERVWLSEPAVRLDEGRLNTPQDRTSATESDDRDGA